MRYRIIWLKLPHLNPASGSLACELQDSGDVSASCPNQSKGLQGICLSRDRLLTVRVSGSRKDTPIA